MSIATAVKPVTFRSTPYSSSSRSCCARSSRTSSAVAGSSGAVSGTIWTMPVSAVSFGVASATVFDAGDLLDLGGEVLHQAERIGRGHDRAGHDERAVEAGTEVLGRQVVRLACLARRRAACRRWAGRARRLAAGIARMPRPTTTATVVMIGCRVTPSTQRCAKPRFGRRGAGVGGRRRLAAAGVGRDRRRRAPARTRRARRFQPTTRPWRSRGTRA